jgi:hypothetical protein
MKLHGLIPNFNIHVPVNDFYIPRIGLPILLQQNTVGGPILWEYINRSQIHECGNWERSRPVSFLTVHISELLCSAALAEIEDFRCAKSLYDGISLNVTMFGLIIVLNVDK